MSKKMKKISSKLDAYEQNIEDNLEKSKPLPSAKKAAEMSKLKLAAKGHVRKRTKEKRISIRVFAEDLERIKAIAEEEGLPYQTLVTSILHKFSLGRLISREQRKH